MLPGYGPNTRTVMQIKVAATGPAPTFNLSALQAAFSTHADGSGVFESGQHPDHRRPGCLQLGVRDQFCGQRQLRGRERTNKCDGYARINQQGGDFFRFDTLKGPQLKIPLEPKAIHDEMNAAPSMSSDE